MSPDQIDLVVNSFAEVLRRRKDAGIIFYQRLFSIAPELRPLFKSDLDVQSRKLMDTLATAISSLHNAQNIDETLQRLGRRHAELGVHRLHYPLVGEALIATLAAALGPDFTGDTRRAWIVLYRKVCTTMLAGAARGAPLAAMA